MKPQKKLIIGTKVKQKLNSQQRTFNRLVKKLEKLRLEKEETAKDLSEKLDFYGKHISPLEDEIASLHSQSTKLFYKFYRERKTLTTIDRETLFEIIATQLSQFTHFSREQPDEELKEIFEFIEGESYDEAAASDFQSMKDEMSQVFEEMGLDADLDGLDPNLDEEEMARKLFELLENLKQQAEEKATAEPKRKKTKKQIEKEVREKQVEDAKNKDIAGIYKQLAKIFHPDLEQDAKRREEKEVLMKQLTSAYKNKDLHTLLRLELEWLQKEEDNLEKLSAEKLKIYNQALKEQTEELELEIHLLTEHPRYYPLKKYVQFFGLESINLKAEKRTLTEKIKLMKEDLAELSGKKPLKKLNEILRITKKHLKMRNTFDFDIEDLFR